VGLNTEFKTSINKNSAAPHKLPNFTVPLSHLLSHSATSIAVVGSVFLGLIIKTLSASLLERYDIKAIEENFYEGNCTFTYDVIVFIL
jgi:hypothetical protein